MLKYLPTQASIGSDVLLLCGTTLAPSIGYYFLGGISSVFKSDRVLAINDDAAFLGGRAALII